MSGDLFVDRKEWGTPYPDPYRITGKIRSFGSSREKFSIGLRQVK